MRAQVGLWVGRMALGVLMGLCAFEGPAAADTARFTLDPDHSIIEFQVRHMVISKTTGRFNDYSGFVELDPEAGQVKAIEATIKAASLSTNHEKRDAHLRGADFSTSRNTPR